jgi:PKD repeat protein
MAFMIPRYAKTTICFVFFTIVFLSIFVVTIYNKIDRLSSETKENENLPLFVKIFADKNSGKAPFGIEFSSLALNNKSKIKYHWDFGDGETSEEQNPLYIYEKIGSYICTLTVVDSNEKKTSDHINITVLRDNPPMVKIVVDKTDGNRPTIVNFNASCFDFDGEIISYEWEIKQPPFFSYQKVIKHDEKNFSEKFFRPGLYEIKLIVKDDGENSVTDYLKIQIYKSKPELLIGNIKDLINKVLYSYNQLTALKEILNKLKPST